MTASLSSQLGLANCAAGQPPSGCAFSFDGLPILAAVVLICWAAVAMWRRQC